MNCEWRKRKRNRVSIYCKCRKGVSKPMATALDFCAICFKLRKKGKSKK